MKRFKTFWFDFADRYRRLYLLGLLCLGLTTTLAVAIPAFVQYGIDALAEGRGLDGVLPWAMAILGAGVAVIFTRTLSRTLFFNPGRAVEFRVKSALFEHLLKLPKSYYDGMKAGDLISRGTNDANSMRSLTGFAALNLFNVLLTLLLTGGRMFQLDWALALWCMAPLALAMWVLRYAVVHMFRHYAQLQAQLGHLSDRILESYTGAPVLQAFNAVPGAMGRFDEANDQLYDISRRLLRIRSWLLPIVAVVGKLCVVIVLYIGGRKVVQGTMSLGELTAFMVYINILVMGLTSLGWLIGAVQRGVVSLGRVYEVLDAPVERPPATAPMPRPAAGVGHAIDVKALSFTHPGATRPALRDVSFSVAPGETVGVFGLTGAGKTTLLDVISRTYDPPKGAVSISGEDLLDIEPRAYWNAIAYARQEAYLFSRTLRENIGLAAEGEIDPERLRRAIEDASLTDEIEHFTDGLETTVGERGVTLSGGQRQRAALARAFYNNYELLLLDDVMSAVDHATERRLIDAIYRRGKGTTTLIVSHRVSVLSKADRVLVFADGRLIDSGPHAELAQRAGPYADAWRLQQAAERIEEDAAHG